MDDSRYWGPRWIEANDRIKATPAAAALIVARYPSSQVKHARRTAVCAAGLNTPEWQRAVELVREQASALPLTPTL